MIPIFSSSIPPPKLLEVLPTFFSSCNLIQLHQSLADTPANSRVYRSFETSKPRLEPPENPNKEVTLPTSNN